MGANSYAYFKFTTGGVIGDITIRCSVHTLVLYAVNNYDSENSASLPSRTNYNWTSLSDTTSQNILVIPAGEQSALPYYHIGVYSETAVPFTITATTSEAVIVCAK